MTTTKILVADDEPVSYTHLDVYKRQVLVSEAIFPNLPGKAISL